MSKGVVVDGDLAQAHCRADARPDKAEKRDDRQAEFLQETAFAASRNGGPFYSGFNPKKLWKPRNFS